MSGLVGNSRRHVLSCRGSNTSMNVSLGTISGGYSNVMPIRVCAARKPFFFGLGCSQRYPFLGKGHSKRLLFQKVSQQKTQTFPNDAFCRTSRFHEISIFWKKKKRFFVDCTSNNPRSFSKRPLRELRFSLRGHTTQLPKPPPPPPHPPISTLRCTYIQLSYINTRNDRRSSLSSI